MGMTRSFSSGVTKLNWTVISVIFAVVVVVEIAWIRSVELSEIKSLWLSLLPIPFLIFATSFFMWSIVSFQKIRTVIRGVQLIFSGISFVVTLLVSIFWIGRFWF